MNLSPMLTPEAAFERCMAITQREAKNFYYGIRLLRPPKRRAMAALYAFARYIDDIGDGNAPPEVKLSQLASLREITLEIAGVESGAVGGGGDVGGGVARDGDSEVGVAESELEDGGGEARRDGGTEANEKTEVSEHNRPPAQDGLPAQEDLKAIIAGVVYAAREFPIPVRAFEEIIEGCEEDSRQTSYQTIDDTVRYCRLVAGSVGRLSLGVFGSNSPEITPEIADDLGVAMQLTNILRDIVEDGEMGRVYLPAEDIAKFNCAPDLSGPRKNVGELVMFESERALEWFDKSFKILGHLDRRSRACVSAMSGIYFRLLHRIRQNPTAVLDGRVSLPAWEKSLVAARSLAGFRP